MMIANARIRGELLEKGREISYLRNLLSKQKTTKLKMTHADFLQEIRERKPVPKIETKPNRPIKRDFLHKSKWQARQEKELDDTEVWKREVDEEFDKKLVAERNAKFGTGEGMTKTQWMKHIRNKIKEIEDEIKKQVPERTPDKGFVPQKSPQQMYIKMIAGVECECEADNICDTCKLFKGPLWEYTLQLFKDAAEGRTSYV